MYIMYSIYYIVFCILHYFCIMYIILYNTSKLDVSSIVHTLHTLHYIITYKNTLHYITLHYYIPKSHTLH